MYTQYFTNVTTEEIVEAIRKNGCFAFEQALTNQYVELLLQEIDFDQFLVNTNDVGVVFTNPQKFLTHCLAKSKRVYDVVTSPQILEICNKYFSDKFMLVNHRVYQTRCSHYMPWHTDNNLQIGHKLVGKHDMPGLLFIFYLSDVSKNAFQYIKKSHNWSAKYNNEVHLSDELIASKHEEDVVTITMSRGSLIICNTHLLHRAEPFQDRNYSRTSLIFQVDEIGDDDQNIGHGEQSLINTEYMDNLNKEVMEYLGIGGKRNYPAFPNTSVATMTGTEIISLQKHLLPLMLQALAKRLILSLLPYKAVVNAKRIVWQLKRRCLW